MKTLFTILTGGLISVSAFASDVTVSLSNSNKYQVLIDSRNVSGGNYSNDNTVYLRNLSSGQHTIQVIRTRGNDRDYGRNGRNNNNDVVYSSSFIVQPQYDLFISVDKNGRVNVNERRNNNYGNSNSRNGRRNDDGKYDRNNGYGNNGRYDNTYRSPMNDNNFNQLIQNIKRQWFGKLGTAKQSIENSANYFNTYQVRQILQIFSSDKDRLELAKLAYNKTVDRNNYRQLYDLLSYNAQAELDSYIGNSRY